MSMCNFYNLKKLKIDTLWRSMLLKFIVIQKFMDFELWIAPKHSKQLGLTWKFHTLTKLQGKYNPTSSFLKQTLDEGDTSLQSCNHKHAICWTQIEPMNLEWLSKNQYIMDWFENFTTQTIRENTNSPTSFVKFGHSMQKL